jgi:hypothetical protein
LEFTKILDLVLPQLLHLLLVLLDGLLEFRDFLVFLAHSFLAALESLFQFGYLKALLLDFLLHRIQL